MKVKIFKSDDISLLESFINDWLMHNDIFLLQMEQSIQDKYVVITIFYNNNTRRK